MSERPIKFFKYRPMDAASLPRVERTVLHNEAYFAPAHSFNDPFDLRPALVLDATPSEQRRHYIESSFKFESRLSAAEREASADQAMMSMTPAHIAETTTVIQALYSEALATT